MFFPTQANNRSFQSIKKFFTHFIPCKHKYIFKLHLGTVESASEKSQDLKSQLCTEISLSYLSFLHSAKYILWHLGILNKLSELTSIFYAYLLHFVYDYRLVFLGTILVSVTQKSSSIFNCMQYLIYINFIDYS